MWQAGQANTNTSTSKLKTLRKALTSVGVLIVVFIVAGIAYTLFSGQDPSKPLPKAKTTEINPIAVKPTEPGPNAPESAALYLGASSVKLGTNALASGKTNPNSSCTISFIYNGITSKDSGLSPKTADPYGGVEWTWTVDSSVPTGTWPVKMTCVWRGKTAVAISNLQVTP
jgi:hypothetical protein